MLRVLAYHRVAELRDTPTVDCRSVSATPKGFARQMEHLARNYHVLSMPQLLHAVEKGIAFPRRAALITFDDAYTDFAETAWPILKRVGLPATLFVPTAYPDHPEMVFPSDKLYQAFAATSRTKLCGTPVGNLTFGNSEEKRRALRMVQNYIKTIPHEEAAGLVDWICAQLAERQAYSGSVLSWGQLRLLAKEGLTLGSHTRTHPIMTQVTPDRAREEIRASQEDLKREIGTVLPIFCYPNGSHNDTVISILKEEGIRVAFTTLSGQNRLESLDPLRIRRAVITPRTSNLIFRLRLLSVGIYLDAWRHRRLHKTVTRGLPQNQAGVV